jgi:uncharacterized protein (DUF58 family)
MLFDSKFLARLEYLALVSRQVFQGQLMAAKRTRQLGSGIDFADHRPYTPGDDFRYLNFNAYINHDELLLKRFHEEQDLHIQIIVDCSASMAFGSPSKFDHARKIAAALAYIALSDLDRVAIIAIADGVSSQLPMTRGKGRIHAIFEFLDALKPSGAQTHLARAMDTIVARKPHPGPAIVISDFYDPDGFEPGLNRLRYHKHEPHIIQVYDPSEAQPDMLGDLELVDAETGQSRKVTLSESSLDAYKAQYIDFIASLQLYSRTYGVTLTRASTHTPFDELILKMMRQSGVVR